MQNFQFLDILFIAMVAGFVLFRLYSVLGRRTGHERPHEDPVGLPENTGKNPPAPAAKESSAALPGRAGARGVNPDLPNAGPVARALLDIKLADRSFDAGHFVAGARAAYEMIVTAFARGDREALRPLLSDEVYETFDATIRTREERKEHAELAFHAVRSARITSAELKNRVAEITVTFDSEFAVTGFNAAGAGQDDANKATRTVSDIWTFARDIRSNDPNWTLVATASGG